MPEYTVIIEHDTPKQIKIEVVADSLKEAQKSVLHDVEMSGIFNLVNVRVVAVK